MGNQVINRVAKVLIVTVQLLCNLSFCSRIVITDMAPAIQMPGWEKSPYRRARTRHHGLIKLAAPLVALLAGISQTGPHQLNRWLSPLQKVARFVHKRVVKLSSKIERVFLVAAA